MCVLPAETSLGIPITSLQESRTGMKIIVTILHMATSTFIIIILMTDQPKFRIRRQTRTCFLVEEVVVYYYIRGNDARTHVGYELLMRSTRPRGWQRQRLGGSRGCLKQTMIYEHTHTHIHSILQSWLSPSRHSVGPELCQYASTSTPPFRTNLSKRYFSRDILYRYGKCIIIYNIARFIVLWARIFFYFVRYVSHNTHTSCTEKKTAFVHCR